MAITGSEGSGKSNYLGAILAGTMLDEFEDIDLLGAEVSLFGWQGCSLL